MTTSARRPLQTRALLPRWLVSVVTGISLVTPLTAYLIGEYAAAPAFFVIFSVGVRLMGSAEPWASRA